MPVNHILNECTANILKHSYYTYTSYRSSLFELFRRNTTFRGECVYYRMHMVWYECSWVSSTIFEYNVDVIKDFQIEDPFFFK